ncbi:MAG: hypothetical protein ACTSRN_02475, partial [Alphaproteobacteria bacterium]
LEMLARCGAFDQLDGNRRKVMESIDKLVAYSAASHDDKNSNQHSLFGDSGDDLPPPRLPMPEDWLPVERLSQEHMAFGFYLTGHPLDDYMPALKRQRVMTLDEVSQKAEGRKIAVKMAGTIASVQVRKSAKGNRFAFIALSDPSGHYEVTVFSDTLEKSGDLLTSGENVVLSVEADMEGGQLKLLARGFQPVDTAVADAASVGLRIFLNDAEAVPSVATRLMAKADQRAIKGPVNIVLLHSDLPGEVEITLPKEYAINPQIKGAIKHISGVVMVEEFLGVMAEPTLLKFTVVQEPDRRFDHAAVLHHDAVGDRKGDVLALGRVAPRADDRDFSVVFALDSGDQAISRNRRCARYCTNVQTCIVFP